MNPEKVVEEAIRTYVKCQGGFLFKIHADEIQGRETLDYVGGVFGQPFMIDTKSKSGTPTKLQKYLVKRALKQGYISGIVDSVEAFKELFGV